MNSQSKGKLRPVRRFLALVFALAAWTGSRAAQRLPESTHGASVASQAPLAGKPGDYVGSETCAGCHGAEGESFAKTPHAPAAEAAAGTKAAANAPHAGGSGCETCHGPGKAHADAEGDAAGDHAKEVAAAKLIFSFHATPKENSERCLTCHITSHQQETFAQSQHAAAGISCNECHAAHLVHQAKAASAGGVANAQAVFFQVPELPETTRWLHSGLLKEAEPNLCFTCHGNVQAEFALPVHHRVPEGLMKCSDCHNPHGSINRASLNATNWETCVKCHVEKRGPYVYEHPAVRVEGCVVCHNPHGNTNRFMLVRREGRMLCLQCHTGFHGQDGVPHSRLGFQTSGECTRCHVAIHGSSFDPDLLR
ncbi:MAG: cytochrome c3 family protein [Terriglobia bacterium]